jgi:hypothetical protein
MHVSIFLLTNKALVTGLEEETWLSMKPESYGFVGDFVIMVILVLEQMLVKEDWN